MRLQTSIIIAFGVYLPVSFFFKRKSLEGELDMKARYLVGCLSEWLKEVPSMVYLMTRSYLITLQQLVLGLDHTSAALVISIIPVKGINQSVGPETVRIRLIRVMNWSFVQFYPYVMRIR